MSKMDEMIIVAPRKEVFFNESLTFQGVETDENKTKQIVGNFARTYSVMRRGDAEENTDYKQPIPYVAIKRGDEIFTYKRLQGGGEKRLHNQISLGVGGHLNNVENVDFYGIVADGLQRELEEELFINKDKLQLTTIGLINDDENPVGKVHVGMLVIGELPLDEEVTVRETDQLKGEWIKISDLKNDDIYSHLESWSQFVADILVK
jgi:predicted NUDIX family phosphoesterase